MIVQHNSNINPTWNNTQNFGKGEILILGSFNPFNPNGNNPDFFYGRESNFFWKEIGIVLHNDENYFNRNELKTNFSNENKIIFMDIINSIEINEINNDQNIINDYINNEIFTNFTDSKLFTSTTAYQSNERNILIRRNYNISIKELLEGRNKIRKIIHTLGNSRIDENFLTNPIEINLRENGFQGYINSIVELTNFNNIYFNNSSFSPSQYAVNRGGPINYRDHLRDWLIENLEL